MQGMSGCRTILWKAWEIYLVVLDGERVGSRLVGEHIFHVLCPGQ